MSNERKRLSVSSHRLIIELQEGQLTNIVMWKDFEFFFSSHWAIDKFFLILGSHSAMDSTVLSPLLTPPPPLPHPLPPMIPVDHTTLLSQIKSATRNSILLCGDNSSTTTNTYMADSGFDSSSSHAAPPPVPPPLPSSTPCTAFMIQTQTGNALLIPHSQGRVNRLDLFFELYLIVLSVCHSVDPDVCICKTKRGSKLY